MIDKKRVKAVRERFFLEFAHYHLKWLHELTAAYKERGIFPVFPTQIIEYYPDRRDKEVAAFTALVMEWYNGGELAQIRSLRELMGEHPYEWLTSREFVTLSTGSVMQRSIDGAHFIKWWMVARVFDMLYDRCNKDGEILLPSKVFRGSMFADFCRDVGEAVGNKKKMDYMRGVTELVLRTSDGLGRGLWGNSPHGVKCPVNGDVKAFMLKWFPDFKIKLWTWDEAVRLFGFEKDTDFFYAYLAYKELCQVQPTACSKYLARYTGRWESGRTYKACDWTVKVRGIFPEIKFEELTNENF